MNHSESIKNLSAALSKAQTQVSPVLKKSQGYGYKYAALDAVMNSARDALSANGLSVVQGVEQNGDAFICVTMLTHSSGEWMRTECPLFFKADKKMSDAQAFGSAYTYARRYSFQALVGIAPEDDDGRSAGQNTRHPRNNAPRPPAEPPQQFPAVQDLSKLGVIMGWDSMPPLSGYLAEVNQIVDGLESITADQIVQNVKNTFVETYKAAGGSARDEWSPEQLEALQRVGNVPTCDDLVALCRGVDALR